jgi:GGDEF domain-containing protein
MSVDVAKLIDTVSARISAHAEELTELDSAVGDADHGLNMKRGFDAVLADKAAIAAKPFLLGPGSHLTVTASLGVSSLASAQDTVEDLLKRADRALYRAKREGRNRVVVG